MISLLTNDVVANTVPIIQESTIVIIPAYNESNKIKEVLDIVTPHFAVVVVDDGSSDNTALVAKMAGAYVIRHPINLGQGAALQTGFDFASLTGVQWVITFDADGQHDIHDARRMLDYSNKADLDICFGTRFSGKVEKIPLLRKFLLKGGLIFQKITTGARLTDTHNGLRVINTRVFNKIRLKQNRMAHATEIVESVVRQGLKYDELPITIKYSAYSLSKGQSNLGAINIIVDWLLEKMFR